MNSPIEQPSLKELKRGYWIATHREQVRRDIVIAIGVVIGLIVAIAVFLLARYLINLPNAMRVGDSLVQSNVTLTASRIPKPIVVDQSVAVFRGDGTIDVVVFMKNQNTQWAATAIDYEVVAGSSTIPTSVETLGASQEKVLLSSSVPFTGTSLPSVRVAIKNVQWKKVIDASKRANPNWAFTNASLDSVASQANDELPYLSQLSVTMRNNSVYGYKNVSIVAVIPDEKGGVRAASRILLDRITSLESRDLIFRYPVRVSGTIQPQIYVNTDIVNESNLIREVTSSESTTTTTEPAQ
jgi:hypothetical protein